MTTLPLELRLNVAEVEPNEPPFNVPLLPPLATIKRYPVPDCSSGIQGVSGVFIRQESPTPTV